MIKAITCMTDWFTVAKNWPNESILPNLHKFEDHVADFIETWPSSIHGLYGKHGAESIHKIFKLQQKSYCSMQPATIRLQSMLKEHYRLVHPDA